MIDFINRAFWRNKIDDKVNLFLISETEQNLRILLVKISPKGGHFTIILLRIFMR